MWGELALPGPVELSALSTWCVCVCVCGATDPLRAGEESSVEEESSAGTETSVDYGGGDESSQEEESSGGWLPNHGGVLSVAVTSATSCEASLSVVRDLITIRGVDAPAHETCGGLRAPAGGYSFWNLTYFWDALAPAVDALELLETVRGPLRC